MLPKDSPGTQESSPSPHARAETQPPRETRGDRIRMEEQSYEPVVPVKVGNRRASARSGHGTHWREGGNRCTYLTIGNIDGAQNSTHYVHTNRQNIRTSQGGSEATILFDRSSDHARGVIRGIPGTKKESQRRSGRRQVPDV